MLHLAGKASIRCRPVNSALGVQLGSVDLPRSAAGICTGKKLHCGSHALCTPTPRARASGSAASIRRALPEGALHRSLSALESFGYIGASRFALDSRMPALAPGSPVCPSPPCLRSPRRLT